MGSITGSCTHRLVEYPDTGMGSIHNHGQVDFLDEIKEAVLSSFVQDKVDLVEKVVIVGDSYVGKSSLLARFCKETIKGNYKSTVGVDFTSQTFEILGKDFRLQLWDTAGQERFKSIVQSYYRGAHGIIVAFDLSSPQTLQNSLRWVHEVRSSVGDEAYVWLVGLKSDLKHFVTTEMACQVAKSMQAEYWEVSSVTGSNVRELFHRVAAILFQNSLKRLLKEFAEEGCSMTPTIATPCQVTSTLSSCCWN
eukprot:TRINITY_DN4441_c0_g1_i9.p1 TRINITY_DN4441_c0_g1~~TRINITY_DN4441_c0_g1_i9.p1  ORF type:complete len:250 (+),score=35.47 TRINITY_DN4441_c0_g1_i9:624-1373(+)